MQHLRRLGYFLALTLALAPRTVLAAETPITPEARSHFEAGVNFLQDPDGARYEEAYREFQQAYRLSPSWKILGNLGLAAMKLERDGEAIDAYRRYLTEGGQEIDPEERAQMERDLMTLEASAAKVTLESIPPGATLSDERAAVTGSAVVNRYGPLTDKVVLRMRSGHHRLTARLQGYEDAVWELDILPGSEHSHVFELKKAEGPAAPAPATPAQSTSAPAERPVPTGVYIGLAATGAFAVGAGVVGVLALGKKSEYDDANDGSDPAAAEDIKSSGETLNLVTDVLIGASVVSAGVTAILYFTRPEKPPQQEARVDVTPLPGGAALSLTRRF